MRGCAFQVGEVGKPGTCGNLRENVSQGYSRKD